MIIRNKFNEIRSGYKIISVILFMLLAQMIISIILGMILSITYSVINSKGGEVDLYSLEAFLYGDIGLVINIGLSNIITILGCILLWRIFENKKISDMGLISIVAGYKDLIVGLVMGAISISIVAIILLATGTVKFDGDINNPNLSSNLIWGIILFVSVGFGEEIFGRAYIMSVLKQTRNKLAIIIISSLIFAVMHLGNSGISILAFINLSLVGALFAYMFMKGKNIWMPIGYHITWNYFQGYIWGFQVSGITTDGLYSISNVKDNLINGGTFGPEGGIVVTAVTCLFFVAVYFYYKRQKIEDFIDIIDNKEITV